MMSCNILLLFGIIFASTLLISATDTAQQKHNEECIKELGNLTPDEIKLINDDKVTMKKDASKNLKCYLLCVYKKNGIVTSDGKQNPDAVIKYLQSKIPDKSKMMPAMASCVNVLKSGDPCAEAFDFEECVMSKT